jgi:hypothetical protein
MLWFEQKKKHSAFVHKQRISTISFKMKKIASKKKGNPSD